ncbi:MAG: adenylyltransferase/cytidyltransferase family protein [Patescibacteria group bacterium]
MKKVMVFGTFDGLHAGHLNLFKQAKKFGDQIIVVIARDKNVKKIKGRLPKFNELKRLGGIKKINIADTVVLGQIRDPYQVIKKYQPDIICLGYDQVNFTADLKKLFPKIKIIRLKSYQPNIYKSSKINKNIC